MPSSLRLRLAVAFVLSVALGGAAWWVEYRESEVLSETEVELRRFERALENEEGAATAVSFGDPFVLTRARALEVQVSRPSAPGWVGVLIGLVPQGDSEAPVRDVTVELMARESRATEHFSQVEPATYRLRIEGASEARHEGERVRLRVIAGRRSPWPLALAFGLVWLPALAGLRRVVKGGGV